MANYVTKHEVAFAASATSTLKFDPRDVIVAIEVPADFVGVSMEAEFSFDDGATYGKVYDDTGAQACIISDASMGTGRAYTVSQPEWDVTNFVQFRSSIAETGRLTVFTKSRV